MIAIVNVTPLARYGKGINTYEVRINTLRVCRFKHAYADGLSPCLLRAWKAVYDSKEARKFLQDNAPALQWRSDSFLSGCVPALEQLKEHAEKIKEAPISAVSLPYIGHQKLAAGKKYAKPATLSNPRSGANNQTQNKHGKSSRK